MLQTVVLVLALLFTNMVLLSPLSLSSSTRRLIQKVGRKNLFWNYSLGIAGLTLTQVLVAAAQILFSGGEVDGTGIFWLIGFSTVGVVAILALILGFLPLMDLWNPSEEDEIDGRIVIGTTTVLYGGAVAVFSLMFVVLAIAFFFPG